MVRLRIRARGLIQVAFFCSQIKIRESSGGSSPSSWMPLFLVGCTPRMRSHVLLCNEHEYMASQIMFFQVLCFFFLKAEASLQICGVAYINRCIDLGVGA
jgi:hypothetical protein